MTSKAFGRSRCSTTIIADTPSADVSRPIWLGRFLDDALRCAIPRPSAFDDEVREADIESALAG